MRFCTGWGLERQLNRVKSTDFSVKIVLMKTITEIYADIIEKLRNEQRPRVMLTPDLLAEIKLAWSEALTANLTEKHNEKLKQIFCVLDNAATSTNEFNDLFIKSLNELQNSELLIYCLAASRKHIIEHSFKSGNMISYEYFEALKKLLESKNPELKEWTLRTIETLGPMSLRLKQEVIKAKPTFLALLNKHQKASAQIIDYLEKEWKRIKL
jgi:hypothetical protein